jgi:acyl dehydratase
MPLNYEKLKDWRVDGIEHRYGANDTILYALGIGLGQDPLDASQLRFVYEKELLALPTMATILAYPWGWLHKAEANVNRVKLVHAEQGIRLFKPIPAQGELAGETRVTNIVDKGREKGALIYSERRAYEKSSGDLLFSATATTFCRADGGFDGPAGPVKTPVPVPDRAPDFVCDIPTMPQAALIYRLNGDRNPLHIEPAVGQAAGFPGPILHGLCTFGVAGHALLKSLCGYDPTRLTAIDARFSAPVYPGEVIRTEIWRGEGGKAHFQARIPARDSIVLSNGVAEIQAEQA